MDSDRTLLWYVPLLLVASTWVSVLSTDLYAPSLPHLPELLGTSERAVKLTMSFNLAAFALAQLVHGPLADRYGRRRMLVAGLGTFALASAICALAPSIEALLVGRTVQGLLSSVPSVVVLLLVHELYPRGRAVRVLGFHGMAVGVAPIVGPLIGGWVFVLLGWRANFWLLAGLAAVVSLLAYRHVPETVVSPTPIRWRSVLRGYAAVLSQRGALRHLFPLAANFGVLFAFVTEGPFLLIDRYAVATQHYGLYFAAIVAAAIAGGAIANRLGDRIATTRLQVAALMLSNAGVAIVAGPVLIGAESLNAIVAGMAVFGVGLGLMNATAPLLVLDGVGDLPKSAASAVSGSLQLAAATVASLLVGAFHDETARPMALTMAGLIAIGTAGYLMAVVTRGVSR